MKIRDVMTTNPVVCDIGSSIGEAATTMRDNDIGDVLVRDEEGEICGIVTDRDLVIRGLAGTDDPARATLDDVCARSLYSLPVDASTADAVHLMQARSLRRVPVTDGDEVVGIVSIGDLATVLDAESALGTISAAPPDK